MTESRRRHGFGGLFISFEGIEGSGKTTQLRRLGARLSAHGLTVHQHREPGGTVIGQQIRRLLLDPAHHEMVGETELLLMFASRTQAAAEVIRPALERGEAVLSDRWTDSTLVYQGVGRELGSDTVTALHRLTLGELMPDITLCLDLDVGTALERVARRLHSDPQAAAESRIDRQPPVFHQRIRDAYQRIAEAEPDRFVMVDADGTPDAIEMHIWQHIKPLVSRERYTNVIER